MNIIKEPDNIDLVVEQVKLTKEDKEMISNFFRHYKETGEILKPTKKNSGRNIPSKKRITKP